MERDFKGVWIPKDIWLNKNLSFTQKVLLVEIDSLDNEKGCFASNEYFAEFFDLSLRQITQGISVLKNLGYIFQESFDGRQRILRSRIKPNFQSDWNKNTNQTRRKVPGTLEEKFQHNNTSNNTSNNNNISKDILFEQNEKNEKSFLDLLKDLLGDFDFIEKLKNKFLVDNEDLKMSSENFLIYWTEKNPNGKKERWQMQKVFDIKKRFYTRIGNDKKFMKSKQKKYTDVNFESVDFNNI